MGLVRFVTMHIQKDKRITLGTVVHKYVDCPAMKGRGKYEISGLIIRSLPECSKCCNRERNNDTGR